MNTPRTDAEQEHVTNLHNEHVCCVPPPDPYYVPAEFARQLERELAAQQARAQHLARKLELAIELKRDLHGRRDAYVAYLRQRNEHLERRVAKLAALRLGELSQPALDKSPPT